MIEQHSFRLRQPYVIRREELAAEPQPGSEFDYLRAATSDFEAEDPHARVELSAEIAPNPFEEFSCDELRDTWIGLGMTAEEMVIAIQRRCGVSMNPRDLKNMLGWAYEEIDRSNAILPYEHQSVSPAEVKVPTVPGVPWIKKITDSGGQVTYQEQPPKIPLITEPHDNNQQGATV